MKKFNVTLMVTLCLSGCVSTQHSPQAFEKNKLIGEWLCKVTEKVDDVTLDVEIELNYKANGQSVNDFTLRTYLPDELVEELDLPKPLKVTRRVISTYVFDGTYITEEEISSEIVYSNLPDNDDSGDESDSIKQQIGMGDRLRVTRLTSRTLGFAGEEDELLCKRTR